MEERQGKIMTEKKYTDADVNVLIDRKFAKWQKKKEAEVSEAVKYARMAEVEKAKAVQEKLKQQLDDLTRQNAIYEMMNMARGILAASDISVSDELLSIIVSEDAEKTKTAIDSFSKLFTAAVEKAAKEWFFRRDLVNEMKR